MRPARFSSAVRDSGAATYSLPLLIRPVEAAGALLRDSDGRWYVDCLAAAGAISLGWNHPAAREAVFGRAIVGRSSAAGHPSIKLTFVNPLVTAELATKIIADISSQGERILRSRGTGTHQRMSSHSARVERVQASDARFPWAKSVEYTIFGLENDYADESDITAGEMVHYRRSERSSEIFVSFSDDSPDEPVGVLRTLRADPELGLDSFSTLRDGRNHAANGHPARNFLYPQWSSFFDDIAPEQVAELATQGVRRKYRRAGMVEQILRTFFASIAADGVDFVTVALVVPLFEWYSLLLPDRIRQIGEIMPNYIGADSVPAVVDISGSFVTDAARTLDVDRGSLLAATANSAFPSSD